MPSLVSDTLAASTQSQSSAILSDSWSLVTEGKNLQGSAGKGSHRPAGAFFTPHAVTWVMTNQNVLDWRFHRENV